MQKAPTLSRAGLKEVGRCDSNAQPRQLPRGRTNRSEDRSPSKRLRSHSALAYAPKQDNKKPRGFRTQGFELIPSDVMQPG